MNYQTIIQNLLGTLIRHGLFAFSAWLSANSITTFDEETQVNITQVIIGLLGMLGTLGWSSARSHLFAKLQDRQETKPIAAQQAVKVLVASLFAASLIGCATVNSIEDRIIADPQILGNVSWMIMKYVPIPENDRVATANDVYAICSLVRSLENVNELASPDQFDNALASAVAQKANQYSPILGLLGAAYSAAYPSFNGNAQKALATIEALAQAGEVYAKHINP